MRTMLLSFQADVYKRLTAGEKIYEHRKVFPDEPIIAYLYVSAPTKAITGKVLLDNKTDLNTWKIKFGDNQKAVKRINAYLQHHRYAMEIREFQMTTQIPLAKLREDLDRFVVPQMYYFIDDTPLLHYLEENLQPIGENHVNDFSHITGEMICVH